MERKIEATRVSDAVARDLEQRILDGEFKPGDRLPAERQLAESLGVSRASLREAIQKLISRGMVVARQGEGTFVTARLENSFAEPWQDMVDAHPSVREDLLEFRHMLESKAAELAAQRASEEDLHQIEAAFERLEDAFGSDDLERLVDSDLAFHQALAQAAHNAVFNHLTSSLLRVMRANIRLNLSVLMRIPSAREQLQEQHRVLWAGVLARDPAAAKAAAERHIDYVRLRLSETLRKESRRQGGWRGQ